MGRKILLPHLPLATLGRRLLLLALAFGLIGTGIFALQTRSDVNAAVTPAAVLPVRVLTVREVPFHEVTRTFVGLLEAGRSAELSFERGGLVETVLVDDGDRVSEGDVVARIDTSKLIAERGRLIAERAQVRARFDLAKLTRDRQEELNSKGHASAQTFDEARLAVAALVAEGEAVDASIRTVDVDLAKTEIIAPFAGTVSVRYVDEGTVVPSGARIVTLMETGRPQARIGVSPEVAASLQTGNEYSLYSGDRRLTTRFVSVAPDVSTTTRTVTALFDVLENDIPAFGELVRLRVQRKVEGNGFWVPLAALRESERGLWSVLIAEPSASVEPRDAEVSRVGLASVEILHVDGERAFVRGTLTEGSQVILGGGLRIALNQPVQAIPTE